MPPMPPGSSLLDVKPLGTTDLGDFKKAGPHPLQPTKIWGAMVPTAPIPTNRWWINLVLADGENGVGENVVSPLPYLVKALSDGLHFCLPSKDATPTYVALPFIDTVSFGARELGKSATHTLDAHDELSATVGWSDGSGGRMLTPLVRGMPYVSAVYSKLTPVVTFATSPIKTLNGKTVAGGATSLSASRLECELANGQTWVVYASKKVEVSVEGAALKFAAAYDGTLRAAVATAESADTLDTYVSRVPLSGHVQAAAYGARATLSFEFKAEGAGELLMMALPHHLDVGHLSGVLRTPVKHSTLKGEMVGVVGEAWTLNEALPPVEWGAPRPIDPTRKEEVRAALKADMEKLMVVPDPYGSGKEMGAVGRLALIADELGEDEVALSLRKRLAAKLEEWLSGGGKDPLTYDPTYGGLVSTMGLADEAADFGGGRYNDHHFHYGYFLYAAACVGRKDAPWLKKWAPAISHLIRDIANPSSDDPLYPPHRFKDWYVGHSWASGLFPSASGRNQESVSEALNAWYAISCAHLTPPPPAHPSFALTTLLLTRLSPSPPSCTPPPAHHIPRYGLALYGLALGDASLRDLGRVMLATELRSGWKYWQIDASSTIYPEEFAKNGLAAVVWSTKVDKTTWFGSNVEYSYGIQVSAGYRRL